MATYHITKSNATRRGKPFTLTPEQFAEFCYKTDYIAGKGRTKTSLSIDRMINELGYVAGNIAPLPLGLNSKKKTKSLIYDWRDGYAKVVKNF